MEYKHSDIKRKGNTNVCNMHHCQEDWPKKAAPLSIVCYSRKAPNTMKVISPRRRNEDQNGQHGQILPSRNGSTVKGPLAWITKFGEENY